MSKNLSTAALTEFDNEVKHAFQKAGILRDTVTVRSGVVGDTYKFAKMGKGVANQKATQADVTPMDITHTRPSATLANWNAPEYTDIFDQAEVNFDEKSELAFTIAAALGRRLDQIIIDAIEAEASPAADIANGATNLTVAKIVQCSENLNDKGVPGSERHFLTSAAGLAKMLNTTTVTSADYNNVKALVMGDIDTFVGFKFHIIETRSEGGLTKSGNIRNNYAYHKSAVGLAIGIDMKTAVDWIAEKTSWLCNGMMKAGAVSRDGDGIVHVDIDESA